VANNPKMSEKAAKISLAFIALGLSLLTPLMVVISMLAMNGGLISYTLGFDTLSLGLAPKMAMLVFIVTFLILLICLFRDPKRSGLLSLAAVALSGLSLGGFYGYTYLYEAHPPIYDVATDWGTPVSLSSQLLKARGPNALPVEDDPIVSPDASLVWARQRVADINVKACPKAKSFQKDITVDQVVETLVAQDYVIFGRSPWRIEAVYREPLFGFESDLVVKLEPDKIDIRSVSRQQKADLGANCDRVVKLITALKAL
jgi:uncharacterized protein (DUF1499 family)